jgi:hypothetical protein
MAGLNETAIALRAQAQDEGALAGLDEQYEQAQARGVATTKQDRYGQVSPLSVLADVVRQSKSRKDLRGLTQARDETRGRIADNKNARDLYELNRQQERDNVSDNQFDTTHGLNKARQAEVVKQNQKKNEQFNTTAANKKEAAFKLATAKLKEAEEAAALAVSEQNRKSFIAQQQQIAEDKSKGLPQSWMNPDGTGVVTGYPTSGGGLVDGKGKPIDIDGKVSHEFFSDATNTAKGGDSENPVDLTADIQGLEYIKNTFTDSNLKAGTGSWADPVKLFANLTNQMPEAQVATNRMNNMTLDAITPMLQSKLFGMLSDSDRAALEDTAPNAETEPLVAIKWVEDKLKPRLLRAVRKDPEFANQADAIAAKFDEVVRVGMIAQYPEKAAERYGEGALTQPKVIGTDGANQAEDGTPTTTARNAANAPDNNAVNAINAIEDDIEFIRAYEAHMKGL